MNGYRYMTLADRQKLESLYLKGERVQDIADTIGVHVATVYKELKRGETGGLDRNMRREYSAMLAQRRLAENFKRRGRKPEDAERWEIASVITAEAEGEPFAGKVAVAQCILQACEDDGIGPFEALTKYKYSRYRPEPCEEALAAVQAVFDFGQVASTEPIKYFYAPERVVSDWHESQVYVMTINGHRFFKEATE